MEIHKKYPKIVKYLKKEGKATPSAIASHINSDIRTTKVMLDTLEDPSLRLVKHKSFEAGKKTYSSYSLADGTTKFGEKQNGGK